MLKARHGRLLVTILALALLAALARWLEDSPTPHNPSSADRQSETSSFDYYLIALSWSPTWCEDNPRDQEQCDSRGFGFILHGLWPQHERGGGPQHCAAGKGPDHVTRYRALAFMPSRNLIEHEWRAHGSCSGLDATSYFELADRAFASVRIPPLLQAGVKPPAMTANAVRSAFVDANPGMQEDMLGVSCDGRDLSEVRICVDKELNPRSCGRGVRMSCPRERTIRIPASR